jgi:hypothetical protein
MGPRPELAMPISTVMSLNSEPQRGALKTPAVQRDAAGKDCVGMRSSRKSNPTLMAQSDAKRGMTLQIPSERMSVQFQVSAAGRLPDSVGTDSKVERILPRGANVEIVQRKSLNKAPRLIIARKPGGPHLDRHSARVVWATAASRIHQQISKPPGPVTVRQSETNKPNFITAARRQRGISFVQGLHTHIILGEILSRICLEDGVKKRRD